MTGMNNVTIALIIHRDPGEEIEGARGLFFIPEPMKLHRSGSNLNVENQSVNQSTIPAVVD